MVLFLPLNVSSFRLNLIHTQVSDERLGEHARATLGEQASAVSSHAFAEATAHGSVETFALVRPAAANDHAGVYIYLDEV
jgi:hypothetical protein